MTSRRVVVTGLGVLSPIGNDSSSLWEGLESGVSGAAPITLFDASKFRTRFACEVKNLDVHNFIDRKDARKMDRFCQLAMIASDQAIKDSGIDLNKLDKDNCGVIWGGGIGGLGTFENELIRFTENGKVPRFNPYLIPKMITSIAPGLISIKYGFGGPNFATHSACASSSHALIDALNYIRWGYSDLILSGGSEATVTYTGIGGFNAMHALSTRNDDPAGASKPYDKERDGFVLGEGAGALILESYEHAKARGAKIYAEFVGAGLSSDAYHMTAPHPEGSGVIRVIQNALKDARLKTTDIDSINTHGTSTPLGDVAEANAILSVFGEHTYSMNLNSTKSMTGHLLGAAGAVESIASILSILHQTIPPTINHQTIDQAFDSRINFTFNEAQSRKVNYIMSNTFGFGGHNACLVFKKLD
ncbi:MAG: beta-ketoacyl-ACP synthase II [Flavobacteriaceae bacterium]|nr:beta-ketoacyl-ACP synthase II [Flavobacteriaceae bacterium]